MISIHIVMQYIFNILPYYKCFFCWVKQKPEHNVTMSFLWWESSTLLRTKQRWRCEWRRLACSWASIPANSLSPFLHQLHMKSLLICFNLLVVLLCMAACLSLKVGTFPVSRMWTSSWTKEVNPFSKLLFSHSHFLQYFVQKVFLLYKTFSFSSHKHVGIVVYKITFVRERTPGCCTYLHVHFC